MNPGPTAMLSPIEPEGNSIMEPSEIMLKFADAGLKQEDLADLIAYLASIHNGLSPVNITHTCSARMIAHTIALAGSLDKESEIDYESFINGIFSMYDPCTRKDAVSNRCMRYAHTCRTCLPGASFRCGLAAGDFVNSEELQCSDNGLLGVMRRRRRQRGRRELSVG